MKQQNVGLTVNLRLGLYLGSGCWLLDGMWAKPSKFCESSGLSAEASSIIQAFFCRCKGGQPLQVPLAGAWSTPNFSKLSKVWVEFACRHWKSTFSLQATAIFRSGSHDTCISWSILHMGSIPHKKSVPQSYHHHYAMPPHVSISSQHGKPFLCCLCSNTLDQAHTTTKSFLYLVWALKPHCEPLSLLLPLVRQPNPPSIFPESQLWSSWSSLTSSFNSYLSLALLVFLFYSKYLEWLLLIKP